jgi:hypothetical protein
MSKRRNTDRSDTHPEPQASACAILQRHITDSTHGMVSTGHDIKASDQQPPSDESPTLREAIPAAHSRTGRLRNPGPLPTHLLDQYRVLVLLLWLLAALSIGRIAFRSITPFDPAAVAIGVDPNTAPWWDLTALPGVGKATAQSIISFRRSHLHSSQQYARTADRKDQQAGPTHRTTLSADSASLGAHQQPVFQNPMDLTRVRGIGPRTVQRLAPYIRFESADHQTPPTHSTE